jgi:hypothetical protein
MPLVLCVMVDCLLSVKCHTWYFIMSQTKFYNHIQGNIKSKCNLNVVNDLRYISLFCKFTLSKIHTKLIKRTEGLMVVTRFNYVNLLSLGEGLKECKLIK